MIHRLEQWVRKGNVNCHHMLLLLRAELHPTQQAFDEAIAVAGKLGFLHNQALGNERAGLFFLAQGDKGWASSYLANARTLYEEWGAHGKVRHLDTAFEHVFEKRESRLGSAIKGRSRLDLLSKDAYRDLDISSLG